MELAAIDIIVIATYLAGIVAVGFVASRKIHTSTDYAVAGRGMSFPLLCGTLIGTTVGAAATLGNAGKAYAAGYPVLYVSFAYVLGYFILSSFAPRLRRAGIESLPDILQRRYGASMRLVGGLILLLAAVPVVSLQLIACGLMLNRFLPELGLDYSTAVFLAAVVIVLYTLLGGLLAVAYTDLVQVVIMLLGIGLLLPAALTVELGDAAAVVEVLSPPTQGWLGGLDAVYVLSFFPVFTAMVLIDPGVWQRIAAAGDERYLRPALLMTAAFFAAWSLLVVGLGVAATRLYPDLVEPDMAIPQMIVDFVPVVFRGICLAAIMALIMSTADSMLLICGTTVSWDILRVVRPSTPDRTLLLVSRLVILGVGSLAVLFALTRISLFEVNYLALGIFVSGIFVPLMAALFDPRATTMSAVCATLGGALAVIGLQVSRFTLGFESPVPPILAGLGMSAAAYFLARFLSRPNADRPPLLS